MRQAGEVLAALFWSAPAASVLGQFSPREVPGFVSLGSDAGLSEDAACRRVTLREHRHSRFGNSLLIRCLLAKAVVLLFFVLCFNDDLALCGTPLFVEIWK